MHAPPTAPRRTSASRRRSAVLATAVIVALLSLPAAAGGAAAPPPTAPVLDGPVVGAANFVEGASMTFEWHGNLQGTAEALNRSFFRLEVAKAADVPSGAQSVWADLEATQDTALGEAVTGMSLGVPVAGAYRWRVCAWGVVDVVAENAVQQIPGGCSPARSFTTVAAVATKDPIGEMQIQTKVAAPGRVVTVVQERPAPIPEPVVVAPEPTVAPRPVVEPPAEVVEPPTAARYQALDTRRSVGDQGSSVGLDREGLKANTAAGREGIGGAISGGLTSTLPLVPIPFWALALLLACFPIARMWRRDVLGMFDWADGSIDGSGGLDAVLGGLPIVQHDRALKDRSMTADGEATALAAAPSPSDRGSRAA